MANPWLKKNPFMSLWLSGANKVSGAARAKVSAEVKRQTQATARAVTQEFIAAAFQPVKRAAPAAKKRKRR